MRRLLLFWIILATAFGGVPVLAGPATAESDSLQCGGGGYSLPSTSSTTKSCWAKRVTLKLAAPNTVAAIIGSAVVKDTRPVDKGQLAYFSTTIHCYDITTNISVFGVTAQRNIWPGANPAGNYPVAVFKNKPGTYRCQLEVKQYPTGAGTPHSYTLDSFNLTATPSISGASSGGPNDGSWDGLPPDHPANRVLYPSGTQGDDRTEVARTSWTVPAGQSTVQVSGMTNLTACTADSDSNNGCPPKQLGSTKYQVQLLAWQTLSDGSTQCSAPKQYPDPAQVFTLDQYIHHYIPSATGTYTMSNAPGCTRTLIVKTIVTVIGPIPIYVGIRSSAVGAWA